jgi:hypothetical protein
MVEQFGRGALTRLVVAALFVAAAGGQVAAQCVGDCDGDGFVTTAEVALGTEIALLEAPPSACPAFPEPVAVDGLVTAVNNKIAGCPSTPTPTATPIATPTPGGISNAVAGGAAIAAKSFAGIPSLVTAIVTGLVRGTAMESAATGEGGGAGACPLGGTASRVCEGGAAGLEIRLGLDACAVADGEEGSLTLDTHTPITLTSALGQCPNILLPPVNAVADLAAVYRDSAGEVVLNSDAVLTAVLQELVGGAPACVVQSLRMTVSGYLLSTVPGIGATELRLADTSVAMQIRSYSLDCVPLEYTLRFNGAAQLTDLTRTPEEVAPVTFVDLVVDVDARGPTTTFSLDGGLDFDCVEGSIVLETTDPLTAAAGANCPTGGTLAIDSPEGPATIRYNADGSVDVDSDNDGTFDNEFASCTDPMLQLCPE